MGLPAYVVIAAIVWSMESSSKSLYGGSSGVKTFAMKNRKML